MVHFQNNSTIKSRIKSIKSNTCVIISSILVPINYKLMKNKNIIIILIKKINYHKYKCATKMKHLFIFTLKIWIQFEFTYKNITDLQDRMAYYDC